MSFIIFTNSDPMNSTKAFKKHFKMLLNEHDRILMVNLLKEKSEREQLLTTNIEFLLDEYTKDMGDISYYHFDFHNHGIKNLHNLTGTVPLSCQN